MSFTERIAAWLGWKKDLPVHLLRGQLGERAARKHLQKLGLNFLLANFRAGRGEIDLVFRDGETLVFVEVKTRSSEEWIRPAAAVDHEKKRLLSQTAIIYLKKLGRPKLKFRFDIVEVLLEGEEVRDIRHWPNAFPLAKPFRYGA